MWVTDVIFIRNHVATKITYTKIQVVAVLFLLLNILCRYNNVCLCLLVFTDSGLKH